MQDESGRCGNQTGKKKKESSPAGLLSRTSHDTSDTAGLSDNAKMRNVHGEGQKMSDGFRTSRSRSGSAQRSRLRRLAMSSLSPSSV
jgi:hypothetical protein